MDDLDIETRIWIVRRYYALESQILVQRDYRRTPPIRCTIMRLVNNFSETGSRPSCSDAGNFCCCSRCYTSQSQSFDKKFICSNGYQQTVSAYNYAPRFELISLSKSADKPTKHSRLADSLRIFAEDHSSGGRE